MSSNYICVAQTYSTYPSQSELHRRRTAFSGGRNIAHCIGGTTQYGCTKCYIDKWEIIIQWELTEEEKTDHMERLQD